MTFERLRSLLLALSLAALACGNPITPEGSLGSSTAADLAVSREMRVDAAGIRTIRVITARFLMEEYRQVAVERVEHNGVELRRIDQDLGRRVESWYTTTLDSAGAPASYAGELHTFAVWGANGIPSMRDSIVAPPFFQLTTPMAEDTLERGSDLRIVWAPDSASEDDVDISVEYRRYGAPLHLSALLPDDGAFIVPAQTLRGADPGPIEIRLVRRSSKRGTTTDGRPTSVRAATRLTFRVHLR